MAVKSSFIAASFLGATLATACGGQPKPPPEATARTIAAERLSDVRDTVLRAVADNDGYFTHYCVAVDENAAPGPGTPSGYMDCADTEVDALPSLLSRLEDLDAPAVPASQCERLADSGDMIHRPTGAEPALLVAIGPIEIVSEDRVRLTVVTDAGFLTWTCTLFELKRRQDSEWEIRVEKVLLQS